MNEFKWIKFEKRAAVRGLTDQCSVSKSAIAIGRNFTPYFENAKSVDLYYNNKKTAIGIVPRKDRNGYAMRGRTSNSRGTFYIGSKSMMKKLNIKPGRYDAEWMTTKIGDEEKELLIIKTTA